MYLSTFKRKKVPCKYKHKELFSLFDDRFLRKVVVHTPIILNGETELALRLPITEGRILFDLLKGGTNGAADFDVLYYGTVSSRRGGTQRAFRDVVGEDMPGGRRRQINGKYRGAVLDHIYKWLLDTTKALEIMADLAYNYIKTYEANKEGSLANLWYTGVDYRDGRLRINFNLAEYMYTTESGDRHIIGRAMASIVYVKDTFLYRRDGAVKYKYSSLLINKINRDGLAINPHCGEDNSICLGGFNEPIITSAIDNNYFNVLHLVQAYYRSIDENDEWGRKVYSMLSPIRYEGKDVIESKYLSHISTERLGVSRVPIIPCHLQNRELYKKAEWAIEYGTGELMRVDDMIPLVVYVSKSRMGSSPYSRAHILSRIGSGVNTSSAPIVSTSTKYNKAAEEELIRINSSLTEENSTVTEVYYTNQ
ncbi:MAG: hypothetical protein GY941_11990 [Planctomycetes bacterium]|nr:hypothetical protein [Planctomycetota bacterium]